ncbi:major facilitator superfamily domain-containing protein [Gymnopilus junonius]|uniref:Major facilitator superfamily domain-containing protein n=1 Tax=Gymnopilus junonius TaxID=109634 RepID=A0A9P5TPU3_GYMJU|nr:major facilitator superfamily domain-containing protein [Gymnopilus junonius]
MDAGKQGRVPPSSSTDEYEKENVGLHVDRVITPTEEKELIDPKLDLRTPQEKKTSYLQFITLCWTLVLGDGTMGPPGFMIGSILNMYITPRLGFGKTLVLGSLLQVSAYCIQSPGPPFPAFLLGYAIAGASLSLQDAQANGFVANLKHNAKSKMGMLHACYGFGLFAAPFASTQFAQQPRWSFQFLVSLGMAIMNTILQIITFRFKSLDECLTLGGEPETEKSDSNEGSLFMHVMKSRTTQFIAFFIAAHLGVGAALGGWIVTYIIRVRGGGPSSGYISAGVSGGSMIGRVALLKLNKKLGERNAVFVYSAVCFGLEIIAWRVPSLVGDAIAVCFIGLLLGPMYPMAMNQASQLLPGWMLTGSIGWIAGFGQTGSALVPFVTGVISNKYGLESLPPVTEFDSRCFGIKVDRNDGAHGIDVGFDTK